MANRHLVIRQCLEALVYLSQMEIAHPNIKPENILVINLKQTIFIRLADFGLAAYTSDTKTLKRVFEEFIAASRALKSQQIHNDNRNDPR